VIAQITCKSPLSIARIVSARFRALRAIDRQAALLRYCAVLRDLPSRDRNPMISRTFMSIALSRDEETRCVFSSTVSSPRGGAPPWDAYSRGTRSRLKSVCRSAGNQHRRARTGCGGTLPCTSLFYDAFSGAALQHRPSASFGCAPLRRMANLNPRSRSFHQSAPRQSAPD
jgi:hypothetical protein